MSSGGPTGNLKKLVDAGFQFKRPLPADYQAVVDTLTTDEVDMLISLKKRVDAADKAANAKSPGTGPYHEYFLHPPF
jgi:hypothetical protein